MKAPRFPRKSPGSAVTETGAREKLSKRRQADAISRPKQAEADISAWLALLQQIDGRLARLTNQAAALRCVRRALVRSLAIKARHAVHPGIH